MSKSLAFLSDETTATSDEEDRGTESSFSPAFVNEAIAIAEGRCSSSPTQSHLLALIEFFGGTAHSNLPNSF